MAHHVAGPATAMLVGPLPGPVYRPPRCSCDVHRAAPLPTPPSSSAATSFLGERAAHLLAVRAPSAFRPLLLLLVVARYEAADRWCCCVGCPPGLALLVALVHGYPSAAYCSLMRGSPCSACYHRLLALPGVAADRGHWCGGCPPAAVGARRPRSAARLGRLRSCGRCFLPARIGWVEVAAEAAARMRRRPPSARAQQAVLLSRLLPVGRLRGLGG